MQCRQTDVCMTRQKTFRSVINSCQLWIMFVKSKELSSVQTKISMSSIWEYATMFPFMTAEQAPPPHSTSTNQIRVVLLLNAPKRAAGEPLMGIWTLPPYNDIYRNSWKIIQNNFSLQSEKYIREIGISVNYKYM